MPVAGNSIGCGGCRPRIGLVGSAVIGDRRLVYAHCIDGQADAASQRITDPSAPLSPTPAPAMKATSAA